MLFCIVIKYITLQIQLALCCFEVLMWWSTETKTFYFSALFLWAFSRLMFSYCSICLILHSNRHDLQNMKASFNNNRNISQSKPHPQKFHLHPAVNYYPQCSVFSQKQQKVQKVPRIFCIN